jgi:UDP-2,3-diacylglucosamine pyrophosphatase LpxH
VKASVKRATAYIGNFERVLAERARAVGAHGVICGHIHQPAIRELEGLAYMNCGDWVEHCTALVERWDGAFELVTWTAETPAGEDDEVFDPVLPAPALVR